jgi:aminoglycoside phosphotransferase (APT) family kinase protein
MTIDWIELQHTARLTKIGSGAEATVYALGSEYALRIAVDGCRQHVARAMIAIRAAQLAGIPAPSSCAIVALQSGWGMMMERISTRSMMDDLVFQPWRVAGLAKALGRLHALIHQIPAPAGLPQLQRELSDGTMSSDNRLLHWDFNPANVLWSSRVGWNVIDWGNACAGPPAADVGRTLHMIDSGRPARITSPTLLSMSRPARSALRYWYLDGYMEHRSLDVAAALTWQRFFRSSPQVCTAAVCDG